MIYMICVNSNLWEIYKKIISVSELLVLLICRNNDYLSGLTNEESETCANL